MCRADHLCRCRRCKPPYPPLFRNAEYDMPKGTWRVLAAMFAVVAVFAYAASVLP